MENNNDIKVGDFVKTFVVVGENRKWRRNGVTKTWKTRPNDFRVPVKFGLYQYGYITQDNANMFDVLEEA